MLLERQSARSVQYVKPSGTAPSGRASPGKSMPLRTALAAILLLSVVVSTGRVARADIVSLRNGGEIRGELVDDGKSKARGETITVRTQTGATVAILKGDVDTLVRRRMIVE